ncbi:Protein SUPPRESSOR OF GENE SILENCING [Orobanche minor]
MYPILDAAGQEKPKAVDAAGEKTKADLNLIEYADQQKSEKKTKMIQKGATLDTFVKARKKLLKDQSERKAELKRRHYEEAVNLKKGFDAEEARLMEQYSNN